VCISMAGRLQLHAGAGERQGGADESVPGRWQAFALPSPQGERE
jgi:hypothetical protein